MSPIKKRLIIGFVSIAILTISASLLFWHWMSGSAVGTITQGTPTAHTNAILPEAPEMTHIDAPYFTTTLPSGFSIKRQSNSPDRPVLFEMSATTDGQSDEIFSISVGNLPDGGIATLSDYSFRAKNTEKYTRVNLPNLPEGAIAFQTIVNPAAITVILPHNQQYATMAISTDSAATMTSLEAVYTQAITSWNWK